MKFVNDKDKENCRVNVQVEEKVHQHERGSFWLWTPPTFKAQTLEGRPPSTRPQACPQFLILFQINRGGSTNISRWQHEMPQL